MLLYLLFLLSDEIISKSTMKMSTQYTRDIAYYILSRLSERTSTKCKRQSVNMLVELNSKIYHRSQIKRHREERTIGTSPLLLIVNQLSLLTPKAYLLNKRILNFLHVISHDFIITIL